MLFDADAGQNLALDSASLITAVGGVAVALIAGAVALWQTRRTKVLEKEKIQLQHTADLRLRESEWAHERRVAERERRRTAEETERERTRAAEQLAARRTGLVADAAAYCTRLAQELSTLRILDMSRPLRLDRLYVQVRVQEQQPLRFLRENDPTLMAAQRAGRDRTRDDSRQAPHPAGSSDTTHTYAPVDALQRYQRIVVVGDPGAGKTTMLRHLALRMARQTEGETLPELPAYVELFRFAESGHDDLLDYLAEYWADQYGFGDARAYVAEKLADGTAALLLDGLDEVLGGESAEDATGTYNRVTEEITRLATRYPRAPIATTCRRHGWQGGLPQFQALEALDFEWPQIETFVANWFGERDRRRGGLLRALSANARLQTLATNPLLLSLIAIVYERDLELPERRSALYRRCVEVLLREWDAHRKITRYSRFTTDRKQDLLKEIARHYHERGMRYFPEEDLLHQIERFLPTIDLPHTDSRAILDEIAAQYGLLKAQAHGWYGFLHLTLQEHFAAASLLEKGPAGIERAVAARHEPWWEEVILLLAGSLPDATPLLSGVLQLEPGVRRTRPDDAGLLHLPHDDLFHTDLLLAARCLTGSPRVTDVALRREIIRTVWQLLETSRHDGERKRAAEAVVGVLGSEQQLDEVVAYIADAGRALAPRRALVDALAAHGGRKVGERLLAVLSLGTAQDPLRQRLVRALGELRVEAALPRLTRELVDLLGRPKPDSGDDYSVTYELTAVLGAYCAVGGPADECLRALEICAEGSSFWHAARLISEVLAEARDLDVQEPLLELLVRREDWFFERVNLAGAYLATGGDRGVAVLLDIVRSAWATDLLRLPLMVALVEFSTKGHGLAHRGAVFDLARDDTKIWQVRWLALEWLDHSPGSAEEVLDLDTLMASPEVHISVGAAATLAAWGVPTGLGVIRDAILSEAIPATLSYENSPGHTMSWGGRIAERLAEVSSPYGDIGVARGLSEEALEWLYGFAPERGLDIFLETDRTRAGFSQERPLLVPHSRVHAVLRACLAVEDSPFSFERELGELLPLAAAAADDAESVALLLQIAHRQDRWLDWAVRAYDLTHEVSRRARVRVLPDHTIVPLTT
ncbi:NACHT domain-containing protein [Streptomyces sp. NPDC002817]|uniref:NACHT domain-containing protein n=1 Tax=Streptomyces sp. NPDC088357 TaxID=3154655 RepID=UPI00343FB8BE